MSKNITLVFIALLLLVSLTEAARPEPVDPKLNSLEAVEQEISEKVEGCEGFSEEECLTKRTLMAHTDYIYTQKGKGKGNGN
ncbi:phytosulfokines-like isoform X1 [Phoenix dactylifera]|uniref:Phytosulfokine n=1 Tax=Phoenix dactylifera TaxID=42345 RepID=A0A8B7CGU0_PHODC|nr:phytosulfokines-like isoform X1 [Phoenix dactylifera]